MASNKPARPPRTLSKTLSVSNCCRCADERRRARRDADRFLPGNGTREEKIGDVDAGDEPHHAAIALSIISAECV